MPPLPLLVVLVVATVDASFLLQEIMAMNAKGNSSLTRVKGDARQYRLLLLFINVSQQIFYQIMFS